MRLPFILLIGVVLALLLFMKNPLREFQESRRDLLMKYGTDDLTIKTNLYIEQQQQRGFPLSGTGQASSGNGDNILKNMLQSQAEVEKDDDVSMNSFNIAKGRIGAGSAKAIPPVPSQTVAPPEGGYDGGMNAAYPAIRPSYPQRQEAQPGYNQQYVSADGSLNTSGSSAKPALQKVSNYYPPVMPDSTASKLRAVNMAQKVTLTGNETKLRSGQPIIFDGVDVFTVDASGNRKILPDGNYTLESGSIITVSEGQLRGR